MSLSRKTYSPMSNTYSYSTTLSPTYSYSRVTSYLDALQKEDTVTKLKRQITNVKSIQMKYHSLLQEISMAEKDNRIIENKNTGIEQEYVDKIQQARADTSAIESQLQQVNQKLSEEEKRVESVQQEIQSLLEQLKRLKHQEEQVEQQNNILESEISSCNNHMTKLTKEQEQLALKKTSLFADSKQSASSMQSSLKQVSQLNQMVQKYEQQLNLLEKQSQCFTLQSQNMQALCLKNVTLLQNLDRKVTIQEGENQQLKKQLETAEQQCQRLQNKFINDKENLYQNVINAEEQGLLLKDTLSELDRQLEKDSTEKKYLKDISTKHAMLTGQNEQMRELLKHLQATYSEKKAQETSLLEQVNTKLRADEMLKSGIEQRAVELNKIKHKLTV